MIYYQMSNIDKSNKNKQKYNTDYRSLFFFGFILNCAGISSVIATRNPAFIGVMAFGIIFMLNSWVNKDKWYDKNV